MLPKKILFGKLKTKLLRKFGFNNGYFPNFDLESINETNYLIDFNNNNLINTILDCIKLEEKNNLIENEIIKNFLDNKVDIFGHTVTFENDYFYNFNTDFINNYSWADEFKKSNIKSFKINPNQGYDIKVPWEIGRLQFITQILFILINKNEDEYLEGKKIYQLVIDKIIEFVSNFIKSNPHGNGIQWISAMDVSIRMANLIYTMTLLKTYFPKSVNSEFENIITKSIFEHVRFVLKHLEWSQGMRANHYYSNIAGLIIVLFQVKTKSNQIGNNENNYNDPKYKELNSNILSLQKFVINELIKETIYQFNEEGSNFEDSLPYHFLQVEFLQFALNSILSLKQKDLESIIQTEIIPNTINQIDYFNSEKLDANNAKFPTEFSNNIYNIYNFSKKVLNLKNEIKKIGDDDSGRFIKFDGNDNSLDFTYRIKFFEYLIIKSKENKLFDINDSQSSNDNNNPLNESLDSQKTNECYRFDEFGIYKITNENYEFYLKASEVGQLGKGGHSHNDNLSFILDVLGEEIFTDPGTYNYTKNYKERNKFRSTEYHNLMQFEKIEQNIIEGNNLDDIFWMYSNNCNSKINIFNESILIAENQCYGAAYKRAFLFKSDNINCKEVLELDGNKSIYFHLTDTCKIKDVKDNKVTISKHSELHPDINIIIDLEILDNFRDKNANSNSNITDYIDLLIDKYDYATNYLKKVISNKIIIKTNRKEINWSINIRTEKILKNYKLK